MAEVAGGHLAPPFRSRGRRRSKAAPLGRSETVVTLLLPVILFCAHMTFGAARLETALLFTALLGLYAAQLMAWPWARRGLDRIRGLGIPAGLFSLTLAAVLWPLTPFVPGGPHPVWSYVEGPGSGVVDRSAVVVETIKLCGLAAVFLATAAISASERRARLLFRALAALSVAYVVWAVFAHLFDPHFILGVAKRFHIERLTGSFLSANTAGTLLGASLVLLVCVLFEPLRRESTRQSVELTIRRTAPAAAGVAVVGVALLLTASRGAIAATAVTLGLLFLSEAFRGPWRWRTSSALVLIALGAGLVPMIQRAGLEAVERTARLSEDLVVRSEIFSAHWAAFEAAPWFGYGLGGFERINQLIISPANYNVLSGVNALHNVYIQWAEEAGGVGAAAMFATLAAILTMIGRGALRHPDTDFMLKATLAVSGVILLHGLSDYALQVPSIQAWWACLLGLGFGLAQARRS